MSKKIDLMSLTREERELINNKRVKQATNQVISGYFFLFVFALLLIIFL